MIFPNPGPKKAPSTTIKSRSGILIKKSTALIIISSITPPEYPAIIPKILPPNAANKALPAASTILLFAPAHIEANKSIPKSSVPNQCSLDGGISAFPVGRVPDFKKEKSGKTASAHTSTKKITAARYGIFFILFYPSFHIRFRPNR